MKILYITTPREWLCINLIISIIAFNSTTRYKQLNTIQINNKGYLPFFFGFHNKMINPVLVEVFRDKYHPVNH